MPNSVVPGVLRQGWEHRRRRSRFPNGQPLPSLRSVQWPASQLLHALTLTCIISDKCLFSMGNEECNVV